MSQVDPSLVRIRGHAAVLLVKVVKTKGLTEGKNLSALSKLDPKVSLPAIS